MVDLVCSSLCPLNFYFSWYFFHTFFWHILQTFLRSAKSCWVNPKIAKQMQMLFKLIQPGVSSYQNCCWLVYYSEVRSKVKVSDRWSGDGVSTFNLTIAPFTWRPQRSHILPLAILQARKGCCIFQVGRCTLKLLLLEGDWGSTSLLCLLRRLQLSQWHLPNQEVATGILGSHLDKSWSILKIVKTVCIRY